jgi:hypothetical protein
LQGKAGSFEPLRAAIAQARHKAEQEVYQRELTALFETAPAVGV